MITLLTVLFVLLSLALVVTVPVALATPGEWESSKENFTNFFKVWVGLVFVIATADGITNSIYIIRNYSINYNFELLKLLTK